MDGSTCKSQVVPFFMRTQVEYFSGTTSGYAPLLLEGLDMLGGDNRTRDPKTYVLPSARFVKGIRLPAYCGGVAY